MKRRITILTISLSIIFLNKPSLVAQCNLQDSLALIDFYNELDGPNWTYPSNMGTQNEWLQGPVWSWYGVGARYTGSTAQPYRAYVLDLFLIKNISGTIPPSIGTLTYLETLRLVGNHITGAIPDSILKLSNLADLELSGNQITAIPDSIGLLTNLKTLYLSNNLLTDSIPSSIGLLRNLEYLNLDGNKLTEVPEEINNLTNLIYLTLNNNNIDKLPRLIQSPNLNQLRIEGNRLTFEDIIPNMDVAQNVIYSPQQKFDQDESCIVEYGKSTTLRVPSNIDYELTLLQWTKNGVDIPNADGPEYTINNVTQADSGDQYVVQATNIEAPLLTLTSGVKTLRTRESLYEGKWRSGDEVIVITKISDDVQVSIQGGAWQNASVGQVLTWGDEISTGLESNIEIMMPEQSKINIHELTVLKVGSLFRETDVLKTKLLLKTGELEAHVRPKKTVISDFSVRTPTATASVRGTYFGIAHDTASGKTTVSLANGHVQVSDVGESTLNNGTLQKTNSDSVMIADWQQITVDEAGLGAIEDITLTQIEINSDTQEFVTGEKMWFTCTGTGQKGFEMRVKANWSTDGGTIDTTGFFTAGDQTGQFIVTAFEPTFNLTKTMNISIIDRSTGIKEINLMPKKYILNQNYPNPFNPTTQIQYELPKTTHVKIGVYNLKGQKIKILVDEQKPAGCYKTSFNGDNLSSGLYFYKIEAEDFQLVKKMMLMK